MAAFLLDRTSDVSQGGWPSWMASLMPHTFKYELSLPVFKKQTLPCTPTSVPQLLLSLCGKSCFKRGAEPGQSS